MRTFCWIILCVFAASCGGLGITETVTCAKPVVINNEYHTLRVVYVTSDAYEEYPATFAGMRLELVSAQGAVVRTLNLDSTSKDFQPSPDVLVKGQAFLLLWPAGVQKGHIDRYVMDGTSFTNITTEDDRAVAPVKMIYDTLVFGMNAYNEQLYYDPFPGNILSTETVSARQHSSVERFFFLVGRQSGSEYERLYYYENGCGPDTDAVRFADRPGIGVYNYDSAGLAYRMQSFRDCEHATVLLGGAYVTHHLLQVQDTAMAVCSEHKGESVQLIAYSREGKILWNYAFNDPGQEARVAGSSCRFDGNTLVVEFNASQYIVLDRNTGALIASYH